MWENGMSRSIVKCEFLYVKASAAIFRLADASVDKAIALQAIGGPEFKSLEPM